MNIYKQKSDITLEEFIEEEATMFVSIVRRVLHEECMSVGIAWPSLFALAPI